MSAYVCLRISCTTSKDRPNLGNFPMLIDAFIECILLSCQIVRMRGHSVWILWSATTYLLHKLLLWCHLQEAQGTIWSVDLSYCIAFGARNLRATIAWQNDTFLNFCPYGVQDRANLGKRDAHVNIWNRTAPTRDARRQTPCFPDLLHLPPIAAFNELSMKWWARQFDFLISHLGTC